MPFKMESEKVAKLTRAIIDGTARRYKTKTLGDVYKTKPELKEMYQKWHYNILTDFFPGSEMEEMICLLLLCYDAGIDIDNCDAWLMYYGYKSTLLSKKIAGLTNISKVAFMEQEKKEDDLMEASEWLLFPKDNSL